MVINAEKSGTQPGVEQRMPKDTRSLVTFKHLSELSFVEQNILRERARNHEQHLNTGQRYGRRTSARRIRCCRREEVTATGDGRTHSKETPDHCQLLGRCPLPRIANMVENHDRISSEFASSANVRLGGWQSMTLIFVNWL